MTRLEERLERLAERGPVVEPRFVVRAAMQRASLDAPASLGRPSERTAWDEESSPAIGLRLQERIPSGGPRWQHRPRMVGIAAAAVIAVAGVGGVVVSRSASVQPAANMAPANTADPALQQTTSSLTPTSVVDSARADDPMWMAWMFSLLDVPTKDEMVTFLSYNIPESEVAACMHNAGFQYSEAQSEADHVAVDPRYILSPADYAATYGLGITAFDLGLLTSPLDPNLDYVSSLSEEERDSYVRWYGSCAGATSERMEHSTAVNVAFDEFRARLLGDAQIVAAEAGWRDCMATAGYVYDSRQSMLSSFYSRMNSGITHAELQQLFTEEVAVATAAVPCESAYKAAYRDVASSRFGEFRDLLDAAFAQTGS